MALNHARWVVVVVFQYYLWMKSDRRVSPDQSVVIFQKKYRGLTTIINMKFWKPSYQTKLVENRNKHLINYFTEKKWTEYKKSILWVISRSTLNYFRTDIYLLINLITVS
jgi:hypothetical protein